MRETELKAVVPDEPRCVASLVRNGATRVGDRRLMDRRYDYPDLRLTMRDIVLRVRVEQEGGRTSASLDWKGAATFEAGYKHREETTVGVADHAGVARILQALGLGVTRAIDRDVSLYQLGDATLRFERFANMDTLLEVEGPEAAIETAIAASGIPRASFVPDRLYQFVERYEARTGQRAAICDDESMGAFPYRADHA